MSLKNSLVSLHLKDGDWTESLLVNLAWNSEVLQRPENEARVLAGTWELAKSQQALFRLIAQVSRGALVFDWFAQNPRAQFLKGFVFSMSCCNQDGMPPLGTIYAFQLQVPDILWPFPPFPPGTKGDLHIAAAMNSTTQGSMHTWSWLQ